MSLQRSLAVPLFFSVESGDLCRMPERLRENNLVFNHPLVVSGATRTREYAMELMASTGLDPQALHAIDANTASEVSRIVRLLEVQQCDAVIAVGGGKVIDVAKMASYRQRVPLVVIPTTLSSDGIASPIAVIRQEPGQLESLGARIPIGILVDLDVIRAAPLETLQAGVGDLLSNLSAVEDWQLASQINGERVDPFALLVARGAAESFLRRVREYPGDRANLRETALLRSLAEGLIMSGLAMAFAGSSRPCSGAEHLVSHALDRILTQPFPHGLQVAVATLFAQRLRGKDPSLLRGAMQKLALPITPASLGVSRRDFLEAVRLAPAMRPGRKTILDAVEFDRCEQVLEELCDDASSYRAGPVPVLGGD